MCVQLDLRVVGISDLEREACARVVWLVAQESMAVHDSDVVLQTLSLLIGHETVAADYPAVGEVDGLGDVLAIQSRLHLFYLLSTIQIYRIKSSVLSTLFVETLQSANVLLARHYQLPGLSSQHSRLRELVSQLIYHLIPF